MKIAHRNIRLFSTIMAINFLFFSCAQYEELDESQSQVSIDNSSFSRNAIETTLSGEDLFKSIFFGLGSFSENITLLEDNVRLASNLEDDVRQEMIRNTDSLISEIRNGDSDFFERFRENITSRDHFLIESALQDATFQIRRNIDIFLPGLRGFIDYIENDVRNNGVVLETNQDLDNYINRLQEENANNELLNQNIISSGDGEDVAAFATIVWAVAAVVYFAVAVHNTIGVTALVYFKVAFWGPSLKSAAIQKYRGVEQLNEDQLKVEILIDQIANYDFN